VFLNGIGARPPLSEQDVKGVGNIALARIVLSKED